MTKDDDTLQHRFQELTCDDTEQKQPQIPFQVVLVDIKKAAEDNEIHCVETSLEESAFVALSYRWGELQEAIVDTQVGYLASITSFSLYHFYHLCYMMTMEPDLKFIQYVWVDAICVNQTNYEKRKATIHQMSNIYEHAKYIVAVPDLHMLHLFSISEENKRSIYMIHEYPKYLYHLIHGNTDQLQKLDEAFLDYIQVPSVPTLRHLLKKYTNYFMDGFTTDRASNWPSDTESILDHLYEASQKEAKATSISSGNNNNNNNNNELNDWKHPCHHVACPFASFGPDLRKGKDTWRAAILKRSIDIRRGMRFLEDLIVDWSSRVWVISEYHIAKKKNNLKYWFFTLELVREDFGAFFTFDFDDPAFSSVHFKSSKYNYEQMPVQLKFHDTMISQLNTQSFFEKILKSNASKNEDRFYAILPLSKYQDHIHKVPHWKIKSLLCVKLKLYEIMDTKDKLNLLLMSATEYIEYGFEHGPSLKTLPSFATSTILWFNIPVDFFLHTISPNFDFHHQSTIVLKLPHENDAHLHCLQLIPKGYYVTHATEEQDAYARKLKLFKGTHILLDMVTIPCYSVHAEIEHGSQTHLYHRTSLLGSFIENKWQLYFIRNVLDFDWSYHANEDKLTVFHIY